MTIFTSIKKLFVEANGAPNPETQLTKNYGYTGEPEVSFKDKIYYHSISPHLQVGVTGYARLLDLSNIMINSDNEQAKKIIEDWIDITDFKTKFESMGNTFLICGNSIFEKLDENRTLDVAEVDMSTIIGKERDEYGNTLYYIQSTKNGPIRIADGNTSKFIEFNLNTISRGLWSPCIFEAAAIPRKVGNRSTLPLVELVVGLEDAMSTIILNNAYPELYYTFEGANDEELKKEVEKIRKRKPGDKFIGVKKPQIDIIESKGQSAYVDYIKYMYTSLSLSVKFPVDILTGDFTSRASSDTTSDLTVKLANSIKRYLGNKLKHELFDPILLQNGINPKDANLQVTFGMQEITKLLPSDIVSRVEKGIWTKQEGREWDKDNGGVDLFDDDKIEQNELDMKTQFTKPDTELKKEVESINNNLNKISDTVHRKIKSEPAKESILTEINKIQQKIDKSEIEKKRIVLESRKKEILDDM